MNRILTDDEWLEQIRIQPEAVARLLNYENRAYHLQVDANGYVWNGGQGAGYGTSFRIAASPGYVPGEEKE